MGEDDDIAAIKEMLNQHAVCMSGGGLRIVDIPVER